MLTPRPLPVAAGIAAALRDFTQSSFERLPPAALDQLLAHARTLRHAAQRAQAQPLLHGKRLGLMCESADRPDAQLFRSAATELGAHVSDLRASLGEHSALREVHDTARMLGRLYDAVECQGLPATLVACIGRHAGIPVFEGLAAAGHPTVERLALQLDGDTATEQNRRFVVQAMLLANLA